MPQLPATLLERLERIARSLADSGRALALLGLGSVGVELERLDAWSDLDFFVVVQDGEKRAFVDDLGWLAAAAPLAWTFRNTADGYKVLFTDGIYAEFAVFERHELEVVPYAEGRIVWKAAGTDDSFRIPKQAGAPAWRPESVEWVIGEILSCLYVGLCRWHRGEGLSAFRFVQGHAFNLLQEAIALVEEPAAGVAGDLYTKDRRFEARYPWTQDRLGSWLAGYDRTPQAALAILAFVEDRFSVAPAIRDAILSLANGTPA